MSGSYDGPRIGDLVVVHGPLCRVVELADPRPGGGGCCLSTAGTSPTVGTAGGGGREVVQLERREPR